MALAALSPSHLPLVAAFGGLIAVLLAAWATRLPRLALSILFLALIAGQLVRLPLPGQGGGLLLSDVAVVFVLFSALAQLLLKNQSKNHESRITNEEQRPLILTASFVILFMLWSLFTLLIHLPELGLHNFSISLAYWLRLTAYLLLLPALVYLFRNQDLRQFAQRGFTAVSVILIILGFLQLFLFSDFSALTQAGWDPHQWRLTSTWLDPNFFGGFMLLVIPYLASRAATNYALRMKNYEQRPVILNSCFLLLSAALAALILTQSRSAAIALGISTLLMLPFWLIKIRSRARLVTLISLAGFAVILASLTGILFRDRLTGLFTVDATVAARATSLTQVWHLAAEHSLLGVGYNAYQFTAQQVGLIGDFTIHSRAGADNSWLTLWVTTGLPGVMLFFAAWLILFGLLLSRWLRSEHAPSLAAAFALLALFIHSQFVNSFLYAHLLITLVVIVALALASTNEKSSPDKGRRGGVYLDQKTPSVPLIRGK